MSAAARLRRYHALAGHLTPAYAVSCRTWGGQRTPAEATCAMEPMTPDYPDPLTQQQLRDPMPGSHQITTDVLPGRTKSRAASCSTDNHGHRPDLVQAQQHGQMHRIPGYIPSSEASRGTWGSACRTVTRYADATTVPG
jgi:hypothetical protein